MSDRKEEAKQVAASLKLYIPDRQGYLDRIEAALKEAEECGFRRGKEQAERQAREEAHKNAPLEGPGAVDE